MNFDNYTIKAQEVIKKSTEIASNNQQQIIDTGHLLKAIIISDENIISFILNKLAINQTELSNKLEEIIIAYPKSSETNQFLFSKKVKHP